MGSTRFGLAGALAIALGMTATRQAGATTRETPRAKTTAGAAQAASRDDAPPATGARHGALRRFLRHLAHPFARRHGVDQFVRAGEPQWVTANFGHDLGLARRGGAAVDVFAQRDGGRWERLGDARTSRHGEPTRAADGSTSLESGRVAFRVPDAQRLGVGLHRVRFVVRGDGSATDAYVNVVAPGARFVVSDVDGTLTEGERANFWHTLGLRGSPRANPGAPATLRALAARGYQILYLTGRPAAATAATHAWLAARGFPAGVVRTNAGSQLGLNGAQTARYKTRELRAASAVLGRAPDYAFGNTAIDVAAYAAARVAPERRFFYRYDGALAGGRRLADYRGWAPPSAAPTPPQS